MYYFVNGSSFCQRWKSLSNNLEKELLNKAVKDNENRVYLKILRGKKDFRLQYMNSSTCEKMSEYLKNYTNGEGGEFYIKKYQYSQPRPFPGTSDKIINYCEFRYKISDN